MKSLIFFLSLCSPGWLFSQSDFNQTEINNLLQQADSLIFTAPSDALIYADIALKSKQAQKDCNIKSTAFNLKTRALFASNRAEDACEVLDRSIPFQRKCKNDAALAAGLTALSLCLGTDTTKEVLDPLQEAVVLARRAKDTLMLGKIYSYLARNWSNGEQPEKALRYNQQCEALLKNSTNKQAILQRGVNRVGMGNRLLDLYYDKEDLQRLKQADTVFSNALKDLQGFNHRWALGTLADAQNGLGGIRLYSDDLTGARQAFEESYQLCIQIKDTVRAANVLYNLSILSESRNDFLSASDTLEVANRLAKNYTKEDISPLMENQLTGALYEERKMLLNSQHKAQKMEQRNWIIIGFLLSLVIGFLFYRQKMLAQRRIELREMENKLQQREISFVREKIDAEAAERLRIARKLHDDVGGMLVSTKWNLEAIIEDVPEGSALAQKLAVNLHQQEESYQAIREVSHQLKRSTGYWWEDLERFCTRIGNGHPKIQFYTFNLDESVIGPIGEAARITTQELIVNALKSAKATEINVQISRVDHLLSIFVRDDGVGFDTLAKSDGIGFANIRERIEQELGGSFSIESTQGEGTSVFVDIPLGPLDAMDTNPLKFEDNDD